MVFTGGISYNVGDVVIHTNEATGKTVWTLVESIEPNLRPTRRKMGLKATARKGFVGIDFRKVLPTSFAESKEIKREEIYGFDKTIVAVLSADKALAALTA